MKRILFVCTGNTCRSPLAEALARVEARRRGLPLEFGSAGTFAGSTTPAAFHSIRAAGRRGADLSAHRSRALTAEMLSNVDLAVAMSPAHLDAIRHLDPDVRAELMTEFLPPGDERRGSRVPDPFGGGEQEYEEVADVLEICVRAILDEVSSDR